MRRYDLVLLFRNIKPLVALETLLMSTRMLKVPACVPPGTSSRQKVSELSHVKMP